MIINDLFNNKKTAVAEGWKGALAGGIAGGMVGGVPGAVIGGLGGYALGDKNVDWNAIADKLGPDAIQLAYELGQEAAHNGKDWEDNPYEEGIFGPSEEMEAWHDGWESVKQGVAEDDGFDDVSNYTNMRTTDTGNKSNQTYTSTAIAKNPATGQQKSMASWDHTDPKTGKNYSGSNYIDPQGNAEVQKNYEESKNKVNEVSLGDYRKKATMSKALAQTNKFFDRDNPAAVAATDQTIANRTKGLARADARIKPYTPPTAAPADLEKQQRDLTAKYPNIDELVRRAELNRDPDYEMADGQAYYAARDAEQNYQKLRQIQRVIQGLNESLNRSHLP